MQWCISYRLNWCGVRLRPRVQPASDQCYHRDCGMIHIGTSLPSVNARHRLQPSSGACTLGSQLHHLVLGEQSGGHQHRRDLGIAGMRACVRHRTTWLGQQPCCKGTRGHGLGDARHVLAARARLCLRHPVLTSFAACWEVNMDAVCGTCMNVGE